MPQAKMALKLEPHSPAKDPATEVVREQIPPRLPSVMAGERLNAPVRPVQPLSSVQPSSNFQARNPAITGEAVYRGYITVDGIISGQLNASGSCLSIKQRPRNTRIESTPELDGDISFKDMLRVNGHIAGRVASPKGTLIVDAAARVDASVDVAVAIISGTVNGEIVARERVELGSGAVINGNISTPKLSIKPGATFQGDCRMLSEEAGPSS